MSGGWVHFVRGRESISIHLVILITQIQCRDPSSKRLFSSLHFIPSLTLCILLLNRKVLPVRRSGVGGRRIRETKPLKDLFSKVFKPHFSTSLAQFPVYFTGCRNSLPTWVWVCWMENWILLKCLIAVLCTHRPRRVHFKWIVVKMKESTAKNVTTGKERIRHGSNIIPKQPRST